MYYLSAEDILYIHFRVVEDFGGSHGIRDENRLISMVQAPKQIVFGKEQYPTIFEKTAVYCRNIIGDHMFIDGNKRTGITVASIFLMKNGYKITASSEELEDFAVQVAVECLEIPEITKWFKSHSILVNT